MSACEFAAQGVRMEMEKVAGAPGLRHGRGRGCSGGSKHLRHPHAYFECGPESGTGQVEKYNQVAESDFFFRRSWPNCGLCSSSWTS